MNKKVTLVACVSKKLEVPAKAMDLYISPWFKLASEYARLTSDRWFILSARYGLVYPGDEIEPYNETLEHGSPVGRAKWAGRVGDELCQIVSPAWEDIVILAGGHYRWHLVPYLEKEGYTVSVPMAGLGIGQQLKWLNEQISALKGDSNDS